MIFRDILRIFFFLISFFDAVEFYISLLLLGLNEDFMMKVLTSNVPAGYV